MLYCIYRYNIATYTNPGIVANSVQSVHLFMSSKTPLQIGTRLIEAMQVWFEGIEFETYGLGNIVTLIVPFRLFLATEDLKLPH